jgi:hypothetical protein
MSAGVCRTLQKLQETGAVSAGHRLKIAPVERGI